ncbi:hypothetical protein Daus18300_013152 [Diaporthe australafricana]|uniref:Acyltransferase MbtK/IucB-like conserved domain-containing protein n=1 Tax=Diaporthe australafricana TaxID=127596 RepID=A0ABR3W057_9PEZI
MATIIQGASKVCDINSQLDMPDLRGVSMPTKTAFKVADVKSLSEKIDFRLPDGKTEIWLGVQGPDYVVGSGDTTLASWTSDDRQTRVSPAMVDDDRAELGQVLTLKLNLDESSSAAQQEDVVFQLVWVSVYALWLHPEHRVDDIVAIAVDSARVGEYLRCTGLGIISPFCTESSGSDVIYWLQREAFWQGAGAPDNQHWLQSRPEASFPGFNSGLGVFPSQLGFTKKGNVCTVHAVRPPKPRPGALVYSRFILDIGQQLQIHHIDASDPVHFEAYKRWQNSDRVNAGWKERGPDEKHRAYLASQLADPHSMSCVFSWDGKLAGYCELGWVKEDNAACFFGAQCNVIVGEHDQNSHILVGEEQFRGGQRYQAVATSIKHTCFLRDPRTKQVLAEPRYDLAHVKIQDKYLPQEKKKRFHLPHKTAMLFALQRERFFQEAHLS